MELSDYHATNVGTLATLLWRRQIGTMSAVSNRIGQRLQAAGVIDRATLGQAAASASLASFSSVEALLGVGVSPKEILDFACGSDEAAVISESHLLPDSSEVAQLLPANFVRRMLAMPIGIREGALLLAVADPTDTHIVDEAHRISRRQIRTQVAAVDALIVAIEDCYEGVELPAPRPTFAFSARSPVLDEVTSNIRPGTHPVAVAEEREASRHTGDVPIPATDGAFALDLARELDSWATSSNQVRRHGQGRPRVASGNTRTTFDREPRPLKAPLEDVGAHLTSLRACTTRDRLITTLLSCALAHARQVFCFRVRDGRVEGIDSAGSSLGAAAVRRIVLPISAGSTLHDVIVNGTPHFGPLGTSSTGQVLRVATGSRGGRVSMHALWIDARPVGLLVSDDVRTGPIGHERLGTYCHAAGQTLRRLIVARD